MKVFNLQCGAHHVFEGWFASEADYASQCERGLLTCPLCADTAVHKLPSAPRLNFGAEAPGVPAPKAAAKADEAQELTAGGDAATLQALQAAWLQVARRVVAETEDVGGRFAEEARKMHYGESEERGIRGQATREETEALLDEGIAVLPLALPEGLNGPLQ